jgi:hypothetical protein
MTTAEALGRQSFHRPPEERERLRNLCLKKTEEEVKAAKTQLEDKKQRKSEQEKVILEEIKRRGGISEQFAREGWFKGWFQTPILVFCAAGEFFFARWCLQYFQLGPVGTDFISGMVVIMTLEGIDLYLISLRKAYPKMDNHLFMVFGCMALILIFLFIFLTADLRQNVQHIKEILGLATSPEDIVRKSDEFFRKTQGTFIWLMVSLGTAFSLVGGVGYHEVKNRLPFCWQLLKLHKQLREVRSHMDTLQQEITALDTRPSEFLAEFEAGLLKEATEQARRERDAQNPPPPIPVQQPKANNHGQYVPIILSPLAMILIAMLLYFFVLKGTAHGAEYMVLFDLSKSVGAEDYRGKQTEFDKNVTGVDDFIRNHILPGDSLKAMGITEASFSRPYPLLDARIGKDKGQFGENLAKERMALLKSWKELNLKPIANATDILGALTLATICLAPGGDRKLLIFSDMRHNTAEINLEKPKKINADATIAKAEQLGLIPRLQGGKVWCFGVHSAGVTPEYWVSLREFWTKVFHRSGSQLVAYTMERRFQNE